KGKDKPDERAKNWHDRVWRLVPTEVLGKGEKPAAGNPEVMVQIEYTMRGHKVGSIEIAKLNPPPPAPPAAGAPTPPPPQAEYFARTEYTIGWVKLSATTGDLLSEAEKVVSE